MHPVLGRLHPFTSLDWIFLCCRAADHAALLLEHVRRTAGMVLSRPSWNVPEAESGDVAAALARLMVRDNCRSYICALACKNDSSASPAKIYCAES